MAVNESRSMNQDYAQGKLDDMALFCGQSCSQIHAVTSVQQRIDSLLDEVHIGIAKLCRDSR